MFIGIDLGTSGVKVVLMNAAGYILASSSVALKVSRPQEMWSEQDPEDWWQATDRAMRDLAKQHSLMDVQSLGFSGQMHGATLLDKQGKVLRPAILWNDGRSYEACGQLQNRCPDIQAITGNLVMPGFTAPKLVWLQQHEADIFAQLDKILLPKDYLRYRMTGEFYTDVSDASGTLWLDMETRQWSSQALEACGLNETHMPTVVEGTRVTGHLNEALATSWSMPVVPVVAGAGDNAAGAIGMGIIKPKQTMMSLGTSGVIFSVSDGFVANPAMALHSFGHAISSTWHSMSVMLSAASCVQWVADLTKFNSVQEALQAAESRSKETSCSVIFLPYLSGERTPHNDPDAKGVFWGMTHLTTAADLVQAVLEGIGFALLDGLDAVRSVQSIEDSIDVIGGGARSRYWLQLLADMFAIKMVYREGGDLGPALGAARLAALGVEGEDKLSELCAKPKIIETFLPDLSQQGMWQEKRGRFQALYHALRDI
ncbi:xylulokinase [Marinomonas sp. THO17]|uniref:xylulokinase n=1 Tax=Marinomonas sp. THO17 TaxID=3149048 RepID=UPI00336BED77